MYNSLRSLVIRMLLIPPEPKDPVGTEERVLVFRASPKYFQYRLVVWGIGRVISTVVALVGFGFWHFAVAPQGGDFAPLLHLLGLVAFVFYIVQLVFSYVVLRLDYELRWYKVSDRSLRIREGVWHVREMTLTFANIQNLSITQGPIQRALGISDLKVQTAGGGGAEMPQQQQQIGTFPMHVGYFRGVDNAEEIKVLIQERLRLVKSSGLGDVDDPELDAEPTESSFNVAGLVPALRELRDEAQAFRSAVVGN